MLARLGILILGAGLGVVGLQTWRVGKFPDLEPWHDLELQQEFTEREASQNLTLSEYLEREDRLFVEVEEKLAKAVGKSADLSISRYQPAGFNNPSTFPSNWNRSWVLDNENPVGGVLLLHGLSDSPYSLRRVGEIFGDQRFYVLGLRLPGHGTVPAALTAVRWEVWRSVVRMGMRHVRERIGDERPLILIGYSNGGTLALMHSLEATSDPELVAPERIVLFSPAIEISSLARFAGWHRLLSWIPYYAGLQWVGIQPEYDPFKFNSFAKNAAVQSYRITTELQRQLERRQRSGALAELPPVLTFDSLVDSTVITEAVIERLYDRFESVGSELVMFDVNRFAAMEKLYRREQLGVLDRLEMREDLPYRLTVLTNENSGSFEIAEWSRPARSRDIRVRPLGLEWPSGVYSLSHVALCFPPDDPIYGRAPRTEGWGLQLGALEPRGEKELLVIPAAQLIRLRHNPFFSYVEARLRELGARVSGNRIDDPSSGNEAIPATMERESAREAG